MIIAIMSGKPNTMVVGARNLLESNIPQLPKLDSPPPAKHELLEIPGVPGIPDSQNPLQIPPLEIIIQPPHVIIILPNLP